jgi:hypothetical protein
MRLIAVLSLFATIAILPTHASAQILFQPTFYTVPTALRDTAAGKPEQTQQQVINNGDIALPVGDKSQYGASSKVYTLSVLSTRQPSSCNDGSPNCVPNYWFQLSVDANVINAISGQVATLREYIFSQKGSPLSVTLPAHTWTTKKSTARQTWFSFTPLGSARFIPVSASSTNVSTGGTSATGTSSLSGGGTLSVGGTVQADIEFDETQPASSAGGKDMTYPGTLYASATPVIAATLGRPLKSAIFQGSSIHSWVWGTEYRVGFQFKGQNPISLGVTGTVSAKGLTSSSSGFALSLSKLFSGGLAK